MHKLGTKTARLVQALSAFLAGLVEDVKQGIERIRAVWLAQRVRFAASTRANVGLFEIVIGLAMAIFAAVFVVIMLRTWMADTAIAAALEPSDVTWIGFTIMALFFALIMGAFVAVHQLSKSGQRRPG